jgi:hypothetical protein
MLASFRAVAAWCSVYVRRLYGLLCAMHTHMWRTRMDGGTHCVASALVAVFVLKRRSFGREAFVLQHALFRCWGFVLRMTTACQQLQLEAAALA